MTKKEFLTAFSKINETFEDEFRAEFNSPELLWEALKDELSNDKLEKANELIDALESRISDLEYWNAG